MIVRKLSLYLEELDQADIDKIQPGQVARVMCEQKDSPDTIQVWVISCPRCGFHAALTNHYVMYIDHTKITIRPTLVCPKKVGGCGFRYIVKEGNIYNYKSKEAYQSGRDDVVKHKDLRAEQKELPKIV